MPTRTRRSKRRLDAGVELEAFECMFATGRDFFGALHKRLGYPPRHSHRYAKTLAERRRFDAEDAALYEKLAREAWSRLGKAFMATWEPTAARERPYALDAWGEPWKAGR
jgi:hypothetical protein